MARLSSHVGNKQCVRCGKIKITRRFLRGDDMCRLCRNITDRGKEPTEWRTCSKCGEVKPLDGFPNGKVNGVYKIRDSCRECLSAYNALRKPYQKLPPAVTRNKNLMWAYGIDAAEYDRMLAEQGGVCACCKRPERNMQFGKVKPLSVDHCHITGAVRGLLCDPCNMSLGYMREDYERAQALVRYIEERCLW